MANQISITVSVRKAYLNGFVDYVAAGTAPVSTNLNTAKIISYADFDDPTDAGTYGLINYSPDLTGKDQYFVAETRAQIKALIDA